MKMVAIRAHFDGKVIVPEEPVDLPRDRTFLIQVREVPATTIEDKKAMTARDLLNSGVIGMWCDREDIGDSGQFARRLRERAERREDRP